MAKIGVSFCNVPSKTTSVLAVLDTSTGVCNEISIPGVSPKCRGATGLALTDDLILAVIQVPESGQSGVPEVVAVDRARLAMRWIYRFQRGRDVHSICANGDAIYAVSTGTDEVVSLRCGPSGPTSEDVVWAPSPQEAGNDVHHLNGIGCKDEEILIAGFGRKTGQKWETARGGFIWNITRQKMVKSGLDQPHSIFVVDGRIGYCESRSSSVRVVDDPRRGILPGYTRGACVNGSTIFAGTSVGREMPPSTGRLINNPAVDGAPVGRCAVHLLRTQSFELERSIDVKSFGNEIYDLVAIEG